MEQNLLEVYLASEDCTENIRRMLMEEIENMKAADFGIIREYEFNRFNLRMDSEKNEALIEDDLMMEEPDQIVIDLDEFYEALSKRQFK